MGAGLHGLPFPGFAGSSEGFLPTAPHLAGLCPPHDGHCVGGRRAHRGILRSFVSIANSSLSLLNLYSSLYLSASLSLSSRSLYMPLSDSLWDPLFLSVCLSVSLSRSLCLSLSLSIYMFIPASLFSLCSFLSAFYATRCLCHVLHVGKSIPPPAKKGPSSPKKDPPPLFEIPEALRA